MEPQSDVATAAVAGAVVLAALVGGLIVVLRQPSTSQQRTLAILSIFLAGWAMLTALGRVRFGSEQALASRYLTPLVTLWLSIALLSFTATASRPLLRLLTLTIGTLSRSPPPRQNLGSSTKVWILPWAESWRRPRFSPASTTRA